MRLIHRQILILLFFLFSLFFGCSTIKLNKYIKPLPTDWIVYGGNHYRHNFTNTQLIPPLKQIWEYDAGAAFSYYSVIAGDSFLFIPTLKGEIHVVDIKSGKRVGKQTFGTAIIGSPILEKGGIIIPLLNKNISLGFFNFIDNKFNWTLNLNGVETSPVIFESQIFVTTILCKLIAVDKRSGLIKWEFDIPKNKGFKHCRSSPATDGKLVVFGSDDGYLYSVGVDNGYLVWSFKTEKSIVSSPTILNDMVLFGSTDGYFYSLNINNGSLNWKINFGSPIYSSQAVYGSSIYIGGSDGIIRCIDIEKGTISWTFKTDGPINASPLVAGKLIFVGSLDKRIYVLEKETGNLIWSYLFKGRVKSVPVIFNEYLFVASDDGIVTCFAKNKLDD